MRLVKLMNRWRRTCYVRVEKWDRAQRRGYLLMPLCASTGRALSDLPPGLRPECQAIHVENVAGIQGVVDSKKGGAK